jgi:hypothetical protein
MPRVFISYSHDSEPHREAVLALAQQLRAWGLDVRLDRFVPAPDEGWPRWMMAQVESADFVLLVCTATYRRRFEGKEAVGVGKGVTFEGLLATQHLYDGNTRSERFIPVIFEGTAETEIPIVLRPYQRYTLPLDASARPGKLEPLVRHLTDQPEIVAAPLGPLKVLPPRGATAPSGTPTTAVPAAPAAVPAARTALAPATVLSTGGADVRVEPIELIDRLLVSLFPSGEDFRRWVSLGPDGSTLVAEFPGGHASAASIIADGVEVLRSRGYIDAEFFARLRSNYRRRHDDIERAAAAWGTPLSALATTSPTPTPAASPAPDPAAVTSSHGGLHFANGGNVTIQVDRDLVAGDQRNTTHIAAASAAPVASLAALRAEVAALGGPDPKKLSGALDELADELARTSPNHADALDALERIVKVATRTSADFAVRPSVAPHLAALRSWAST